MKFPSLLRREEPTPPADDDRGRTGSVATDTRPDERAGVGGRTDGGATRRRSSDDDATATGRVATDRTTTDPSATDRTDRQPDAERAAEARAATARSTLHGSRRARAATTGTVEGSRSATTGTTEGDRTATTTGTVEGDRSVGIGDRDGVDDGDASRGVPPAPVGPRPRASLLATLGLIVGVAGSLFVLTGALAGYGIALGATGAVLAVLGLIATRRRHIAGKSDALLGIAFGLGAVVLGVLAMTGQYDWPTTDGDVVARFREWLDSQFVDRL